MLTNIVHVTDTLIPGGAERVAVDIANQLVLQGINTFFVTTRKGGELEKSLSLKIKYICLSRNSTFDLHGILMFRNFVKTNKIAYIHAHGNNTAMFCSIALLGFKGIKIIHHDHNSLLYNRNSIKEKLFLKKIDVWITVSESIYQWASKNVGHQNVYLQLNPINLSRFAIPKKKPSNGIKIVLIANYRIEKDHELLLKSVLYLKDNNKFLTNNNLKISCFGNYFNSEQAVSISAKIKEWGLEKFIELNPSTNNVPEILLGADIGLLCSKSEGLPIALLEYMAASLPVIVTNTGEMGRIVEGADCGFVVPVENFTELANTIIKMVDNKGKWDEWGQNGQQFVRKYHSVESVVKELIEKVYL